MNYPSSLFLPTSGKFGIAQLVKNLPAIQETWFSFWVQKIHWRRGRLPALVFLGFPCGSAGEEAACNAGDLGSIPGLGRSPGEGNGYPLQYSGLEISMDCTVHRVTKSWTGLSDFCILSPRLGLWLFVNREWNSLPFPDRLGN